MSKAFLFTKKKKSVTNPKHNRPYTREAKKILKKKKKKKKKKKSTVLTKEEEEEEEEDEEFPVSSIRLFVCQRDVPTRKRERERVDGRRRRRRRRGRETSRRTFA